MKGTPKKKERLAYTLRIAGTRGKGGGKKPKMAALERKKIPLVNKKSIGPYNGGKGQKTSGER